MASVIHYPPVDPIEARALAQPLEERSTVATLEYLATELIAAGEAIDELLDQGDLAEGVQAADARMAAWRARQAVDAMDRLGWPACEADDIVAKGGPR